MHLRSEYLKPVVGYIKSLTPPSEASTLPTNGDVLRCYLYHTERNIPKKGEGRVKVNAKAVTAELIELTYLRASLLPVTTKTILKKIDTVLELYKKVTRMGEKDREKYPDRYQTNVQNLEASLTEIFNVYSQ